jgi:hypothetical protein
MFAETKKKHLYASFFFHRWLTQNANKKHDEQVLIIGTHVKWCIARLVFVAKKKRKKDFLDNKRSCNSFICYHFQVLYTLYKRCD